ncbi:MAG: hypothetical protein N2235_18090 [Fischerella sp.]|nr:hypothetical protein [Fischerella sp.]
MEAIAVLDCVYPAGREFLQAQGAKQLRLWWQDDETRDGFDAVVSRLPTVVHESCHAYTDSLGEQYGTIALAPTPNPKVVYRLPKTISGKEWSTRGSIEPLVSEEIWANNPVYRSVSRNGDC